MPLQQEIIELVQRVADIAGATQRSVSYLVFAGLLASAGLAWELYTPGGLLWWNIVKCGLILLPAIVWLFVWLVLNQLQEAPNLVAELAQQEEGMLNNLHNLSFSQPNGLKGVFTTLREFRKEDGLSIIFDTIGGISLLANPLFALMAFISAALLVLLIIAAPLILIL